MEEKKHTVVYRDARFALGMRDSKPYLIADGMTYVLACHPYEPCLYITDEGGMTTVVHNAFDPDVVLDIVSRGETFTSITGRRYAAGDFCRLVAYAAGKGELGVEEAEQVFRSEAGDSPDTRDTAKNNVAAHIPPPVEGCSIVTDDPCCRLIADYPDSAVDWCLVKDSLTYQGEDSHRRALAAMCRALWYDPSGDGLRWDIDRAAAKRIPPGELFAPERGADRLTYRRAFLEPPWGSAYTEADFARINAALFPAGTDEQEVYEWSTDWSDYFDDGHEWWGALCLTVYDPRLDRYVVITASATD